MAEKRHPSTGCNFTPFPSYLFSRDFIFIPYARLPFTYLFPEQRVVPKNSLNFNQREINELTSSCSEYFVGVFFFFLFIRYGNRANFAVRLISFPSAFHFITSGTFISLEQRFQRQGESVEKGKLLYPDFLFDFCPPSLSPVC